MGRVLVCIIVCMVISISIMMTSVRGAMRTRRQLQTELQMEQTLWMLRAARSRAANRLFNDSDYSGERWDVAGALRSHDRATIEIEISSDADDGKLLLVTSQIGDPGRPVTTTTRSVTWKLNNNPSGE